VAAAGTGGRNYPERAGYVGSVLRDIPSYPFDRPVINGIAIVFFNRFSITKSVKLFCYID